MAVVVVVAAGGGRRVVVLPGVFLVVGFEVFSAGRGAISPCAAAGMREPFFQA
ncbi:hypothetical protein ACIOWM_32130 [Streptomyces anulatus]